MQNRSYRVTEYAKVWGKPAFERRFHDTKQLVFDFCDTEVLFRFRKSKVLITGSSNGWIRSGMSDSYLGIQ